MLQPKASWRRHLRTQPALRTLELLSDDEDGSEACTITTRPGAAGITLQDFVDGCGSDCTLPDEDGPDKDGPDEDG